jgi:hypothetical protein
LLRAARHWTAPASRERRFSNPSIQAACQPSETWHLSREIIALVEFQRASAAAGFGDSMPPMSATSGKFVQRGKVMN